MISILNMHMETKIEKGEGREEKGGRYIEKERERERERERDSYILELSLCYVFSPHAYRTNTVLVSCWLSPPKFSHCHLYLHH
jgi:hypothetical protein